MKDTKYWLIVIGLLLAIIVGGHYFYSNRVVDLQQQVLQAKLQNESEAVKKLLELAMAKKDSVWIFQKEVKYYAEEQKKQQSGVDTVHNVDSLIVLYARERAAIVGFNNTN